MASSIVCFLIVLVICSIGGSNSFQKYSSEAEADRITNLPGQPPVFFQHFAGYIRIQVGEVEKSFFYWFFEAETNPTTKPLVLWLNGGPGCSSVGIGAAQELGPFLVTGRPDQLRFNHYSWIQAANLLFLDSPVETGFSYSSAAETYSENITAHDSYEFMERWFVRFPQYKSHDFYIAGESYAGHYIPQLAEVIVNKNKRSGINRFIKLRGLIIGNPTLDLETEYKGIYDYAYQHAIISDELYEVLRSCNFIPFPNQECERASNEYDKLLDLNIDLYSLYTQKCPNETTIKISMDLGSVSPRYDPCLDSYAMHYFNDPNVQKALHVDMDDVVVPWESCRKAVIFWDETNSVLPIIKELIAGGIRIWIYSGDTDAQVPVTSTRYALRKLGLNITRHWAPWFHRKEVGGWTVEYAGLTFVTVRGAGHEVPIFAPKRSLLLISHFLSNKRLPPASD